VGRILVTIIRMYQKYLSPLLGANCRFSPTCSQYAIEAIQTHGAFKGGAYFLWRFVRCQPLCRGGYDPVPPRRQSA